jgi:hypothetical protein
VKAGWIQNLRMRTQIPPLAPEAPSGAMHRYSTSLPAAWALHDAQSALRVLCLITRIPIQNRAGAAREN